MATQSSIICFYIDFCPCSPSNSYKSLSISVRKPHALLHEVSVCERPHGIENLSNKRVITTVETKRTRDSFLTAVFLSKMSGKKKENVYRKKRKGKPFAGVQRYAKKAKKTPPDESGVPKTTPCEQPSSDSELDQSPSASRL